MEPETSATPAQAPEASARPAAVETQEDFDIDIAELLELYKRIPPPDLRAHALHTARERVVGTAIRKVKDDGIFDSFRKAWLKDLETKPQFQNLIRRVELRCTEYLTTLKWSPDMNKTHLREQLQNFANRGPFVDGGIRDLLQEFHTGHYANPIPKQRFEEAVTRIVSETVQRYIQTATPSFPRLKSNRPAGSSSDLEDIARNEEASAEFSDFDFAYLNHNDYSVGLMPMYFGDASCSTSLNGALRTRNSRSKSPDVVDMEISSPESGMETSSPNHFSPPPLHFSPAHQTTSVSQERLKQNGWQEGKISDDLQGALGLLMLAGDWGQFGEDTEDSEESQSGQPVDVANIPAPPPPPPELSIPLPPSFEPPSPPPPPAAVELSSVPVDQSTSPGSTKISLTHLLPSGLGKSEEMEDFLEDAAKSDRPPLSPPPPFTVKVEQTEPHTDETSVEEVGRISVLDKSEVVQLRATTSSERTVQVTARNQLLAKPVVDQLEVTPAVELKAENEFLERPGLEQVRPTSPAGLAENEQVESDLMEPPTPPAVACPEEKLKPEQSELKIPKPVFPAKRKSSVSNVSASKKPVQVMRIDPPLRPELNRSMAVPQSSLILPSSRSRKSDAIPLACLEEVVVSTEAATRPTRNRKSNSKYSNDNFVLVPTSVPKRPVSTAVRKVAKGDILSQPASKPSSVDGIDQTSPISLGEAVGDSASVSGSDTCTRKTTSSKKKKV